MANDNENKLAELSDVESTTSSDVASDSGEPEKVEWLATTRSRRSTAGNRMKAMLANEEPADQDSDLELLFAEDEDDAGFSDDVKEDASDVQMDSSSDDEDQEGDGDELEGEKELERQARAKKLAQRKRRAQDAIPAKFRKKVRIEHPPASTEPPSRGSTAPPPPGCPAPRAKKKSERLSWIPSAAEMPTRSSERKTTKISKELLHQKMKKDEIRRKKQLEIMERNAKRQAALKKPPMTQAERLAEAALVEKRNSKSLNRWEAAEKQREEERLKKIAALNSRKLDGPVVTFWSGIQELEEGQQKHVGNLVSIEEKAPRKKRQPKIKDGVKTEDASKPPSPIEEAAPKTGAMSGVESTAPATAPTTNMPNQQSDVSPVNSATIPTKEAVPPPVEAPAPVPASAAPGPSSPADVQPPAPVGSPSPVQTVQPPGLTPPHLPTQAPATQAPSLQAPLQPSIAPPPSLPSQDVKQTSAFLAAPILAPPGGMPSLGAQMPMLGLASPGIKSNCLAPPNTAHAPSPLSLPPTTPATLSLAAPITTNTPPSYTPTPPPPPSTVTPLQPTQGKTAAPPPDIPDTPKEAQKPSEPPREGKVTRSCIILQNFDENAIKDRQVQTQILFGRKMNKLASMYPPTTF